ncbi:putative negative regulator of DNA transposition (Rtt106) [Aspergillus clavatus NRRL 1]|uniref:Histone chaperone rtt106 n=1 Tax=Aspergillus clavatus (strain ATCC 1007 / CBS 513.65 / DSM 816 / NCTC 3887 / NRRL 1 / QM 1276 / 107) TaxID=344612 RepID=RT106_ASPCL|nr:negative regulator of DNA transposition (Rtt106), putative [Aspergillus clavatus NRRL 1]A1CE78.1 RecName: Full=Histone chaperone rtt106 [Aspergillus clavatus NRRL 1]EAW11177.1 negative regulator of DNA transposition (Rtt106), putative [Aspergillus clavatus NRRL 1]
MVFATINRSATKTVPATIPAIEEAFAAEPSLKKRVYDAIENTPQYVPLFEDIARYTSSLLARPTNPPAQPAEASEGPAAKKRKLQNGTAAANAQSPADVKAETSLQFYMQDVSFAMPQRKKLTLEITAGRGFLRARNQTSKEVEFGVPMDRIRHVLCLPVPEKAQRQFNFCVIPQYSDGINPPTEGEEVFESMVWTISDGPAKAAFSGTGQQIGNKEGETAESLVRRILNENLSHIKVVRPDEREFVSAMPEAHRKGEKAYHVKAFRGSKEGYLFFLSTGVFFGFKKPLVFFAFENIVSISYTSVLQRTFNLNIAVRSHNGAEDETQEFELSMIDQADYAGIDAYIKKHGLQDASLAEARRAKRYNINGAKAEEDTTNNAEGAAAEEESELQKAQRELEDQEDEDEEDYDPGSDGESEGSGSSSEDDDEDDEDDEEDDDNEGDEDLVAAELGSEAEDVPQDEL